MAIIAGVACSPATLATAKARHSKAHCSAPHGAHVLARDPQLLAFTQTGRIGHADGGGTFTALYVCAPPHGRPRSVYSWDHAGPLEAQSLRDGESAGPSFGFVFETSDQYTEDQQLVVVDATGAKRFSTQVENWPLGSPDCSPCFGSYAIDAASDVAWIATSGNYTGAGAMDGLLLHPAGGSTQTLATASTISDLAIGNGTVSWTADGVAESAPIG